jgi:uncharacterized membrane protein
MPKDDPVTPAPAPRWMRILLVVSLALNLLVAGATLGMVLRGGPPLAEGREVGFGPFAAALSPEDRSELRRAFIARSIAEGDGRRAMREDMRALLGALRADPFDADALRAALAHVAGRHAGRLELGLSLIEDRVLAQSPEERLAFADRLERELRRGPRRRDGGDPAAP